MQASHRDQPVKKPRFPRRKLYDAICETVDTGINFASHRAWKHGDHPPNEQERVRIAEVFREAVLDQICEDFEVD